MTHVAFEPPRELSRFAVRVEVALGIHLRARGSLAVGSQWEALRHAWSLSNLAVRHTEATALMARTDAVLVPVAWVTARAAVEATARCLWLTGPDDVWEREARWVALIREGARLGTRRQLSDNPLIGHQSKTIAEFADAVAAKLPSGTSIPGTPSTDAMLAEHGPGLASFYVLASQFAHGAEYATRQYRAGLGDRAVYGEMMNLNDWVLPLSQAWSASRASTLRLIQATGLTPGPELDNAEAAVQQSFREFRDAIRTP